MNKTLILILILGCNLAFSQEHNTSSDEIFGNEQFSNVEKSKEFPIYPGGIDAFRKNFSQIFDPSKISARGTKKSEVQFIISEEGNISDIKIIGDNKSMNKEMERVAKIMSKTKWIPAKIDGKPVKFRFKLPITMNFDE